MMGAELPVVPMLHQYLVTAGVPEIAERAAAGEPELPIIRDPEESWYLRQERDGFILGPYETDGRPWGVDGVPSGFGMELVPPELDRIEPIAALAMERVPALARGRRQDRRARADHVHTGREPAHRAGLRARQRLVADRIEHGGDGRRRRRGASSPTGWSTAPRRWTRWPWTPGASALGRRTATTASPRRWSASGFSSGCTIPSRSARPAVPRRTTPIYPIQAAQGAVFGCAYGWERPNWFAHGPGPAGNGPREARPAFGRSESAEYGSGETPSTFRASRAREWAARRAAHLRAFRAGRGWTARCAAHLRAPCLAGDGRGRVPGGARPGRPRGPLRVLEVRDRRGGRARLHGAPGGRTARRGRWAGSGSPTP